MKRFEDWLDFLLFVACMVALAIMLVVVKASAGGCMTIEVPPQAVLGNHDGDTFSLFSVQPGGVIKYRVEGVDTPERSKKKGEPDEPGAEEAKVFTQHWLAKGPFTLTTCGKATLDRVVAKVSRNGRTLAQDLIAVGLAK